MTRERKAAYFTPYGTRQFRLLMGIGHYADKDRVAQVHDRLFLLATRPSLAPETLRGCPELSAPWIQIWLQNHLFVISYLLLVIYILIIPPFHGDNTGSNPVRVAILESPREIA